MALYLRADWTSWTTSESCDVTCAEGYWAANETSGALTCTDDEVAGDVVLEVAVPKCLSIVCLLGNPSTGVRHRCRDFSFKCSCGAPCKEGYEADRGIATTSLRLSSGEFVSDSYSQMPCSDTSTQSGVGCELDLWRRLHRRHGHGVLRRGYQAILK